MMKRYAQRRPGREEDQETADEGKTSLLPAQISPAQVDLTRIFPYDKKLRWASVRGAFSGRLFSFPCFLGLQALQVIATRIGRKSLPTSNAFSACSRGKIAFTRS